MAIAISGPTTQRKSWYCGRTTNAQVHRAAQPRRIADRILVGAPDHLCGVAHQQHDREGEQELHQVLLAIEVLQHQAFDHQRDHREARGRGEHADEEGSAPALGHREDDVGAEHVEHAVREIDDPQHAEDQVEAGGDDEHVHRQREAIERVQREHGERHRQTSPLSSRAERTAGPRSSRDLLCVRIGDRRDPSASLGMRSAAVRGRRHFGWMYSAGSIMR